MEVGRRDKSPAIRMKEITVSSPGTATPIVSIHKDDAARRLVVARSTSPYLRASFEPVYAREHLCIGAVSYRKALRSCWATHSAVGLKVVAK